jgi:hypothetical protein
MSKEEKYLCNAYDNPMTIEPFKVLKDYMDSSVEELREIDKEIEKLTDRANKIMDGKGSRWDVLTEKLKEAYPGNIDENTELRYNNEGQIFYREKPKRKSPDMGKFFEELGEAFGK